MDDFSKCVADNTSGRDRKEFARMLFISMAWLSAVERHVDERYPRRGWLKPLFLAVLAVIGFVLALGLMGFLVGLALGGN